MFNISYNIEDLKMYYLFSILNDFLVALKVILLIATATCLASLLIMSDSSDPEPYFKVTKKSLLVFIVTGILLVFVPNQKQAAFVIAAPYILENKSIQETGTNFTEILKEGTGYLKDIINEKRKETVSNGN